MQSSYRVGDKLVNVEYTRAFSWVEDGNAGYGFPCDENGVLDVGLIPEARENFAYCLSHSDELVDHGINKRTWVGGTFCRCGSGELAYWLRDARGIERDFVCEKCEKRARARYAPWVFEGYDQDFLDEFSGERIEDDE